MHNSLAEAILKWRRWLTSEKNMSKHTIRAYGIDIGHFINFLAQHNGKAPSLDDISNTDLRDFRAWMSRKAMDGAGAASRARSLSGIKNFLHWLDRQGIVRYGQELDRGDSVDIEAGNQRHARQPG